MDQIHSLKFCANNHCFDISCTVFQRNIRVVFKKRGISKGIIHSIYTITYISASSPSEKGKIKTHFCKLGSDVATAFSGRRSPGGGQN